MKVHNNVPINGKPTQKSKQTSTSGAFKTLLESEMVSVEPVSNQPQQHPQHNNEQTWHALQESVSLLDQAMQCLESGDMPTAQMIDNIDLLRSQLRQQLETNTGSNELMDAETLLAVEAERIRSLQS
ncbi:hypothetical protein MMIC_P0983 [Mariprofundus micogutta]|uniref:Uncharacterized protein n=1 Tax=Mariprofundus micogutta TaxID=1921010 RepID=A0A1L8CM83_9PROT|nr:hypothetical protein [Mariprofundus micogutta]GAV20022.1 hypothetical protein MMIC_P0983 [Mariprofundus micogutta]